MPALPEVETIKRDLDRYVSGKLIKSVEVRKAKMVSPTATKFKLQLIGKIIKSVNRRAKMLVFELSDWKYLC